jgi:hypothetical protein
MHTVYSSPPFFVPPSTQQSGPITMIPQPRAPLMPCVPLPLIMDFLFDSSSASSSLPIDSVVNQECFDFKYVCITWLVDDTRVLPDIVTDKAGWRHSNCNSSAYTSLTKHLQGFICMSWLFNRHATVVDVSQTDPHQHVLHVLIFSFIIRLSYLTYSIVDTSGCQAARNCFGRVLRPRVRATRISMRRGQASYDQYEHYHVFCMGRRTQPIRSRQTTTRDSRVHHARAEGQGRGYGMTASWLVLDIH